MALQFEDFDSSYLDRLRSGDFSTQKHFMTYFGELIRLKAGKHLRSLAEVEDIRQETFTRVLRLLAQQRIHQPERLGAFVNSVCNNVLREQYRLQSREIPVADGFVDAIPDRTMGVADTIALRQVQEEVREVLDKLSPKDRALLKALFLEERSKDEVCQDFGVKREYLRVLVHRAKRSFKAQYLQSMGGVPARTSAAKGSVRRVAADLRQRTIPSLFAHLRHRALSGQ